MHCFGIICHNPISTKAFQHRIVICYSTVILIKLTRLQNCHFWCMSFSSGGYLPRVKLLFFQICTVVTFPRFNLGAAGRFCFWGRVSAVGGWLSTKFQPILSVNWLKFSHGRQNHKHPAVMNFDPSVNKSAVGYLPTVRFWIFKIFLDGNRPSVTFPRFGWPNWQN